MLHVATRIVLAFWVAAVTAGQVLAQEGEDLKALNDRVLQLNNQRKYVEALPIAQRALALAERLHGAGHAEAGSPAHNLAAVYLALDRHAEAEPLYRRALAIREKTLGPEHVSVSETLSALGWLCFELDRHAEAEPLYRRALAIREKALRLEEPGLVELLSELGRFYRAVARYAEAEPLLRRALAIREKVLGPDHAAVAASLYDLASLQSATGRHADAKALYDRSLAIREKALDNDDPAQLSVLAELYRRQRRYADAEPLYRRALEIYEKGSERLNTARALSNLALLYRDQRRYGDAEPLYRRSLTIQEKVLGPDHPNVALSLSNLAELYREQARYADAEPLYRRALAIRERALGPDHPSVAASLAGLADVFRQQSRTAEAEPLYRRVLAIREKALGADHPDVATSLAGLASNHRQQGRIVEAEPLFRRALAIREKALGPNTVGTANSLDDLATIYDAQGRFSDAERLYQRALSIKERALGPDHLGVAVSLNNIAGLYQRQENYSAAEQLHKRALAIREKALGPEHPDVAVSFTGLGLVYQGQKRHYDAKQRYTRALAIREKARGPDHPDVANSLALLASLESQQPGEREASYKRALAIREKALGPDHPDVADTLNGLADLYYTNGDRGDAARVWQRSTDVLVRRVKRRIGSLGALTSEGGSETERNKQRFTYLIKSAYQLIEAAPDQADVQARGTFLAAQWAQSSDAAASLAQMAVRGAKGDAAVAELVRERQDLAVEWQEKDRFLIAARLNASNKREPGSQNALADRLAAIDARVASIDTTLKAHFPDYAALAFPEPLSVEEVQAQLRADEALVLFFDAPWGRGLDVERGFVWVVTKSGMRWARFNLGPTYLRRYVTALRCGLDAAAWDGAGTQRCAEALNMTLDYARRYAPGSNQPLPFSLYGSFGAHGLYSHLFGAVQDLIADKHLLIVPSGALTQLPFHVLVTDPLPKQPGASGPVDYRTIPWLVRKHAVTVLPAVSSLKALRRVGKPSAAPRPMIGFGNPLLDGPDAGYADLARLARTKQRCAEMRPQRAAALLASRSGVAGVATHGGVADVSLIKAQAPLPETADELCAVAHDLKAQAGDIRLGAEATEREVKRLSASGELAKYRMVHFATHGVLAGELDGTREPGLILTPPATASAEDDGYLSAAEIAGLKLDADWAILSACNTAAGGAANAEALSGLARAFIYAGARAILVSHWAVASDPTVKLVTAAVREMARDAKVGRADALRRAMLALIDTGDEREAHPAHWAPFVVVGEGAAGQ